MMLFGTYQYGLKLISWILLESSGVGALGLADDGGVALHDLAGVDGLDLR